VYQQLANKANLFDYLYNTATRESNAKSIPSIIDVLKINFSKPLLVWYPAFQLSAPPKAPPALASEFCTKIDATRSTARTNCMYGKYDIKAVITKSSIAKDRKISRLLFG